MPSIQSICQPPLLSATFGNRVAFCYVSPVAMKKKLEQDGVSQQPDQAAHHAASDTHKPFGAYHHGNLREALIAVAVARLTESSNADFSIRSLASEIGTSHVAAYRHFDSRRHLIAAVGEQGFRMFNAHMPRLEDPRVAGLSSVDALAVGAGEYVRFAIKNPGYFRAMFHKELPPREDFPEYCAQAEAAYVALMKAVAPLVGSVSSQQDICDAATAVWSIVHGFSVLELEGQFDVPSNKELIDPPEMATSAVRAWALGFGLQRTHLKR